MPDLNLTVTVQLSAETRVLFERLIDVFAALPARLPASPVETPARTEAPGVSAPVDERFLDKPESAEGPSRAADQLAGPVMAQTGGAGLSGKREKWRTPERKALLLELWPTEMPSAEICARLAALPGAPLGVRKKVTQWAFLLGARRPPSMISAALAKGHAVQRAKTATPKNPGDGVRLASDPVTHVAPSALSPGSGHINQPQPILREERIAHVEREETQRATASAAPSDVREAKTVAVTVPIVTTPILKVPQPKMTKAEALSRLGQIKVSPVPVAAGTPQEASQEQIRQWAAQRGVIMDRFDLDAVNAKARAIGHHEFILRPAGPRARV